MATRLRLGDGRLLAVEGVRFAVPISNNVAVTIEVELDLPYWETRASWLYGMRPLIL